MQPLPHFLKKDLESLDHLISSLLQNSGIPLAQDIGRHLIMAGGKRLRPLITLLCAHACGKQTSGRAISLGACIELIHTATLLHDDVIDQSHQRRGKPSAHTVWGNDASILVGDFLFSQAFELMVADGSIETFKILSQATSCISKGELIQLSCIRTVRTEKKLYLEIIEAKTAALFEAAAELGAIAGNATFQEQYLLKTLGHLIGVLFQISDDILDLNLYETPSDKVPGNDLLEGKMTLPLIFAYDNSTPSQKELIEDTIQRADLFEKNFPKIQQLCRDLQVPLLIQNFADPFYKQSLQLLEKLPPSPAKNFLKHIIAFAFDRSKEA